MGEEADTHRTLLEQWKMAAELHRHQDQMAWQSLSYFAALNGVLLSGFLLVLSSDALASRGKQLFGLIMALFGACAGSAWARVHKRMDLYHCLRSHQALAKEKELLGVDWDRAQRLEDEYALIYDERPVDKYEEVKQEVPFSGWGAKSSYGVVFWLAAGLTIAWTVVFLLMALLFVSDVAFRVTYPLFDTLFRVC